MPRGLRIGTALTIVILVVSLSGCNLLPGAAPAVKTPAKVDEAWNIIFHNYVEKDNLSSDNLSEAAIRGILDAIHDPYTSYLNAQDYQLFQSSFQGELDGIGAQVGLRDDQLIIIAPLAGSPAEKAGIRAGDVILEINGQSTSGMSEAEAVLKIRGPKDTPVTLRVLHQGETVPVDVTVTRETITVPSVQFEMVDSIAYISIREFADQTDQEIGQIIPELSKQGATGIILDLRGNPGGLLDVVVKVASYFLHDGVVVQVKDNQGAVTKGSVVKVSTVTDLPMVVLVDSNSASGSEVLSGALQDYKRATLAGTTTYGKGSVDRFFQLSDGSGIYLTVARWLTPLGRPIEGKGLDPDIILTVTGEDAVHWAAEYLKGNNTAPTGQATFGGVPAVIG